MTWLLLAHPRRWFVALVFSSVCLFSAAAPAVEESRAQGSGRASDASLPRAVERAPTVILISLDGTRPADVRAGLPSLVSLGRRGVRAEGLVPVDPTNTFPNHVSLATGVRPEVHRLVNNGFVDPDRGQYSQDDPSEPWIEAEPIWSIAERNGIPTASYFWVGSEGPTKNGVAPREARKFSSRTLEKTKVDQILKWLAIADPRGAPAPHHRLVPWRRPRGPPRGPGCSGDRRVAGAPGPRDRAPRPRARLPRPLRLDDAPLRLGPRHGERRAPRQPREPAAKGRGRGPRSSASAASPRSTRARRAGMRARSIASSRSPGRRASKPIAARPRRGIGTWATSASGDVVVRAPIGTAIVTPTSLIDGFHGYASSEPEMAGLLVAYGRGVGRGITFGRVSSLAVAPTVLTLLGLPIPAQMKSPPIPELTRVDEHPDGYMGVKKRPTRGPRKP